MIVRFFKSGISRGEAPINYLLGAKDSQGQHREEAPEVLAGVPEITVDLINGIQRKHKYASGCLAFRPEEQPTREELDQILNKFKSVVAPGLSADSIDCLFVLHREQPDKTTGLAGFHVHFVIPMVRLDDKHLGKRWNPHPPGQESIELMSLFTSTTNHEMSWQQVQPNPLRVNINNFFKKVEGKPATRKAEILKQELQIGVSTGQIKSREELCSFMSDLGITITRKGNDYISVKFPGSGKAMRLKGPLFDQATNYERLISSNSQKTRSVMLTDLEYQTHKDRLSHLFQKRGQLLTGSPISTPTTIIINQQEKTNGGIQRSRIGEKIRGATATGKEPKGHSGPYLQSDRPAHTYAIANSNKAGQNRSQLPSELPISIRKDAGTSINQRRGFAGQRGEIKSTANGIGTRTTKAIPNAKPRPDIQQHSSNEKQSTSRPTATIPTTLFRVGSSAEEINDQLRKLGMALSYATYEEQGAIQQQINQLVGRKEHLPRPK